MNVVQVDMQHLFFLGEGTKMGKTGSSYLEKEKTASIYV